MYVEEGGVASVCELSTAATSSILSRASRSFRVRCACSSDYGKVEALVKSLELNDSLLADLRQYNTARRDHVRTAI